MLTVTKTESPQATIFHMKGMIDENAALTDLLGPPPQVMVINCREVTRANSIGVRNWIQYFQGATSKGTSLVFQECSPAIVSQMSSIRNFMCDGVIESVCLPFLCPKCQDESLVVMSSENLKKIRDDIRPIPCKKCGGKAEFDDIAEDFCRFLDH